MLSGNPYDPPAADVWACGVCLYAMLFGSFPYEGSYDLWARSFRVPDE